jgi:superfamily I DNA/RNA helicase
MHAYCLQLIREAGLPTPPKFDDYLTVGLTLLRSNRQHMQEKILIVDEAQDLSDVQIEIVRACQAQGVIITLVGDLMQAIYGLQRSSPKHMKSFMEHSRIVAVTRTRNIVH